MILTDRAARARLFSALDGIGFGRLILITPEGDRHAFGQGGPEADLHIRDWRMLPRLALRGDVGLGEGWIAGEWHSTQLEGLLSLVFRNLGRFAALREPAAIHAWRLRLQGLRRATRAKYDAGNEFYQLWLDPGMTYSSALFDPDNPGDDDLARGQARKNGRILSRVSGGERLLDIGCGWGSFAEAAADRGHKVTAITRSPAQKGYADARLDGRADVRLLDYRRVTGQFDAIVSIETMESVGERHWPAYFQTLATRLAPGGRAVLQVISVPDAEFSVYRRRSDFIRAHVFPGGLLPSPAIIHTFAARAGLQVRESRFFGQDYARTCRLWAARMLDRRGRIERLGYGDAFLRGWQYYLESCAATFATGRCDVGQYALTHAGDGPVRHPR